MLRNRSQQSLYWRRVSLQHRFLCSLDFSRPFAIHCDASWYGIDAGAYVKKEERRLQFVLTCREVDSDSEELCICTLSKSVWQGCCGNIYSRGADQRNLDCWLSEISCDLHDMPRANHGPVILFLDQPYEKLMLISSWTKKIRPVSMGPK